MKKFLVFALALAALFFLIRRPKIAPPDMNQTDQYAAYWSAVAVRDANRDFGKHLDYSDESILDVEEILEQLHQQKNQPDKMSAALNGKATCLGFYIGECMRRNHGEGTWSVDDQFGGKQTFPLKWGKRTSFPIGWAIKRVEQGDVENVAMKYQFLVIEREQTESLINNENTESQNDWE